MVVTIANNNATLWPYLTIKDLPDFPLWVEKKIGPTVAIFNSSLLKTAYVEGPTIPNTITSYFVISTNCAADYVGIFVNYNVKNATVVNWTLMGVYFTTIQKDSKVSLSIHKCYAALTPS